ncbi:MAG: hypothetical protein U1F39_01785 [Steroidobacteraceae bacterium]
MLVLKRWVRNWLPEVREITGLSGLGPIDVEGAARDGAGVMWSPWRVDISYAFSSEGRYSLMPAAALPRRRLIHMMGAWPMRAE